MFWVLICTVSLTVWYYHVTYTFQSESTLYSCMNVKEPPTRNRRDVWHLSDSKEIRTQNHLVRKRTLNHSAKLTKWLSLLWQQLSVDSLWNTYVTYNNIQSNAPYRGVLTTRLTHLGSLVKWLSFRLRTTWLWVQTCDCHLNFRYHTCLEQGILWHSGN